MTGVFITATPLPKDVSMNITTLIITYEHMFVYIILPNICLCQQNILFLLKIFFSIYYV